MDQEKHNHRRPYLGGRMTGCTTRTILTATCLALGAGCAPDGEAAPTVGIAVEFVFERFGGLCPGPDGGGAMCRFRVVVRDDGTWSGEEVQSGPTGGSLPAGSASRLASVFDDGWEALTSRAFTGTCPTAYDGSEVMYAVRRLPQGASAELADAAVREVRSCTYDLSHPAARAVLDRLADVWRELGLPD